MPDELLKDGALLAAELKQQTAADVVILADTSYGRFAISWVMLY
jgi:diphthamide synthase subunit DPH2